MSSDVSKDYISMITYKLQQYFRSKLFNQKNFVECFDFNSFIKNKTILFPHRENSAFIDL